MTGYHTTALERPDKTSWGRRNGKGKHEKRVPGCSIQISMITYENLGRGESSSKTLVVASKTGNMVTSRASQGCWFSQPQSRPRGCENSSDQSLSFTVINTRETYVQSEITYFSEWKAPNA